MKFKVKYASIKELLKVKQMKLVLNLVLCSICTQKSEFLTSDWEREKKKGCLNLNFLLRNSDKVPPRHFIMAAHGVNNHFSVQK